MSRVTAPVAKLARSLSSTAAARGANPLLDASAYNAGAVLMPKYAELLRNRRSSELSESRTLTTAHRPTPQPSIANRTKPLMQTFSSVATSPASIPAAHLDAAVLPGLGSLSASSSFADALPRMPLLPDNYGAAHPVPDADLPVSIASSSIVAVNPEKVIPATPLSSLRGVLDTIELKFVHEVPAAAAQEESQGMIRDLWKGMVEDVLGSSQQLRKSN
ncbi:hypothetical protein TARUN_10169 [Trichoderma arundinaceum]|uniref:Uncharacterized protein n=1 Tax=Trichoderma arundinaceum TaxID=490622 RepID=A0A395N886_TRIAR|nr:hypothetical protein TARUN_10169 [Trichoderma arundinaceum]